MKTAQSFRYFWVAIFTMAIMSASAGVCADHRPGHEGKGGGKPGDGDGVDSGTDLKLSCELMDDFNNGDNVLSDEMGAYIDGIDKVSCSTGGTSQPNLSGIVFDPQAKGQFREGDRFMNLVLTECSDPGCYLISEDSNNDGVLNDGLPAGIFDAGAVDEKFWITVRPYREDAPEGIEGHIQQLPEGAWNMAVRFNLKRGNKDPRVVINLGARSVPGDNFQGMLCAPINDANDLHLDAQDALVGTYPDSDVDRFIVTTVDEIDDEGDGGFMKAALCSNIPVDGVTCDGADDSGLCNFHGLVYVRFTLNADVLP